MIVAAVAAVVVERTKPNQAEAQAVSADRELKSNYPNLDPS